MRHCRCKPDPSRKNDDRCPGDRRERWTPFDPRLECPQYLPPPDLHCRVPKTHSQKSGVELLSFFNARRPAINVYMPGGDASSLESRQRCINLLQKCSNLCRRRRAECRLRSCQAWPSSQRDRHGTPRDEHKSARQIREVLQSKDRSRPPMPRSPRALG